MSGFRRNMFYLLSFLWFIRTTKAILFWLYLWQLKEYHIGRFIDHFRTEKGRQILFNKLVFLKIFLLLLSLALSYDNWPMQVDYLIDLLLISSIFILFGLYFLESLNAFKGFLEKTIKKPVWTKKSLFLTSTSLIPVIALFLVLLLGNIDTFSAMLAFDILTPVIVSAIVLFFQPLAVLGRNQIIRKAIKKREQFKKLLVIGITGSYGKTSTKEFLATILFEKFKVLKTLEHQNSEVGISQCIINDLKPEHQIFVCEMGAYNRGGIKLLCDIVKPKIGVVTGVNEQHLATFGKMENLLSAEGGRELIESLPRSEPKVLLRGLPIESMAFFNAKNKYCLELYQRTPHQNKFGTGQAKVKKFLYGEEVKLAGLENIEGAKMIARELGMTKEEIERACQKIENKFPGIQIKNGINGLKIIDATYSANPDGVMAHLGYLKTLRPFKELQGKQARGNLIIVMPCLIELGPASIGIHERIGRKIGEVCDLAIITTKDKLREIRDEAIKSAHLRQCYGGQGMKEENILFIENPKEIFKKLESFCQPGDIVLLESRVPAELIIELVKNSA